VSTVKKLAGQTAIYGGSTIVGRLLNYLLIPLHTWAFSPNEFGSISILYGFVAFFIVLLTFGMETTFFRFVNNAADKEKTFNQAFSIVLVVNVILLVSLIFFSGSIANWLEHPEFKRYVIWFAFILTFDAVSSILMAKLRFENRPKRFAIIQLSSIGTNIAFNLIFLLIFLDKGNDSFGIGYIFLANLLASVIKPILLYKDILKFRFTWNKALVKSMVIFAIPLVIAGFAGIVNEVIDRILLSKILAGPHGIEYAETQVGIYSANYKLSILITLFITAFRYAAEPFFFSQEKNRDKGKVYSKVMNYFVIVVTLIFLVISLNLSIFKWFIPNPAYWEGLVIVPILLMANVFLGIYYNQSIWYKLADKTKYGAYIAVGGAVLTVILNFVLIPIIGYLGAALTTLTVYFSMMIASYYYGQKHYPIKYNLRKIGLYLVSALVLFGISKLIWFDQTVFAWSTFITNGFLLIIFIGIVLFIERPFQTFKKR